MRPLLRLLVSLSLLLGLAAASAGRPDRIVVAGGDRFTPLIFRNARGEPAGMDVDLWRLWSSRTGVEVELRLMDWSDAIPALLRGEVDVVDGVTRTPEREADLEFGEPYGEVAAYVFFDESLGGVRGLDDLAGFPVGVLAGSNTEETLRREAPRITPVPSVNHQELVEAALAGRIRVFVGEEPMISYYLAQAGRSGAFRRTEEPILKGELRMAVRKGELELLTLVEEGLASISEEERSRIRESWVGVVQASPLAKLPWRWILAGLGAVFLGAALLITWNAQLRRRVARATRTLRDSEEHYRTLVESSPVPILVHREQQIVLVNRQAIEALNGKTERDFLGKAIWDLVHPDDREVARARVERLYRGREPVPAREIRLVRLDGEVIDAEVVATPFRYEGDPASLVVFTDVTERKLLEAQLLQAQKMEAIGQLAGGVAHDFNNLLQAIVGYTMLARSKLGQAHPRQRELEEVQKASERAAALTRQLLAFGRRETLRPEPLDLNAVIAELSTMLRRIIPESVDLDLRSEPDLRCVHVDRAQMEQLVMNLCVNARDAMPSGGHLVVETANEVLTADSRRSPPALPEGAYVVLVVRDDGEGMTEEIRAQIFEPFFTTKEVGHGTGLGLTTVCAIVQRWGGAIDVQSAPGQGTTFRTLIPASDVAAPEPSSASPQVGTEGGTETLLLAEDDDLVREMTSEVLREAGYRLLVATDGEEAVRLIEEHAGDLSLAILDVVMPRKSGREVHAFLEARAPGIPVLFSSGYSYASLPSEQVPEDHTQLIRKPYEPGELLRRVRELLPRPG